MTSSHQRAMLPASVSRYSAQPRSSWACLTPYSIQVRNPKVLLLCPTVRSILPGRLVMRCQVVSGGRWTGSVVTT